MRRLASVAVLTLAAAISIGAAAAAPIEVFSGDAFRFNGQRIRIANIDAPRVENACNAELMLGLQAKEMLAQVLAAGEPQIVPTGKTDRFDRTLAFVRVNDEDVGAKMVATGLAFEHGKQPQICMTEYRHGTTRRHGGAENLHHPNPPPPVSPTEQRRGRGY